MKNQWLTASVIAVVTLTANVACGSKFNESSPSGVSMEGGSASERLQFKTRTDLRISELNAKAARLKRVVALFDRARGAKSNESAYTPIDLLIDINDELKSKAPQATKKKLVRYGKITLAANISPECREIETLLESDDLVEDGMVLGETLTYSLKGCGTNGSFQPAFVAQFAGKQAQLQIVNKTVQTMLKATLLADHEIATACNFESEGKAVFARVKCTNLNWKVSETENILFKQLNYSATGDVRFETEGEIYGNASLKALFSGQILSNGKINFDLRSVK